MDMVKRHARFSGGVVVLNCSWSFHFEMLRLILTFGVYVDTHDLLHIIV